MIAGGRHRAVALGATLCHGPLRLGVPPGWRTEDSRPRSPAACPAFTVPQSAAKGHRHARPVAGTARGAPRQSPCRGSLRPAPRMGSAVSAPRPAWGLRSPPRAPHGVDCNDCNAGAMPAPRGHRLGEKNARMARLIQMAIFGTIRLVSITNPRATCIAARNEREQFPVACRLNFSVSGLR